MSIHFHLCKNKNIIRDLTPDMDSTNKTLSPLSLLNNNILKKRRSGGDVTHSELSALTSKLHHGKDTSTSTREKCTPTENKPH